VLDQCLDRLGHDDFAEQIRTGHLTIAQVADRISRAHPHPSRCGDDMAVDPGPELPGVRVPRLTLLGGLCATGHLR
jgi:hypothetical protein